VIRFDRTSFPALDADKFPIAAEADYGSLGPTTWSAQAVLHCDVGHGDVIANMEFCSSELIHHIIEQ
jgi:hypothetical protein